MIPVALQPEPAIFDERVRKRGQHWLREQGWPLEAPPVDASQLPAYWRETQKELWTAYSGVCAYLCIYFEWPLGAQSTDHFVAKSSHADEFYVQGDVSANYLQRKSPFVWHEMVRQGLIP